MQRQIAQVHARQKEQLLGKLVQQLLAEIAQRNEQIAELTKQKNMIESNQGIKAD